MFLLSRNNWTSVVVIISLKTSINGWSIHHPHGLLPQYLLSPLKLYYISEKGGGGMFDPRQWVSSPEQKLTANRRGAHVTVKIAQWRKGIHTGTESKGTPPQRLHSHSPLLPAQLSLHCHLEVALGTGIHQGDRRDSSGTKMDETHAPISWSETDYGIPRYYNPNWHCVRS